MNFEDLLRRAKEGEAEAIRQIHWMYRPLLIKNAMELGIFDEDGVTVLRHRKKQNRPLATFFMPKPGGKKES